MITAIGSTLGANRTDHGGRDMDKEIKSVDAYIETFPIEIQTLLQKIRSIIMDAAPEAEERISYGMPAYKTAGKPLVYFAAFNKHIGLYATPTGHAQFANELAGYKQGKGSVQFPLDRAIPFELINRIVEFRVMENEKHTPS